jgi:hypothetical protein
MASAVGVSASDRRARYAWGTVWRPPHRIEDRAAIKAFIGVPCRRAEDELKRILQDNPRIEGLKTDLEGMEIPFLDRSRLANFTYLRELSIAWFTAAHFARGFPNNADYSHLDQGYPHTVGFDLEPASGGHGLYMLCSCAFGGACHVSTKHRRYRLCHLQMSSGSGGGRARSPSVAHRPIGARLMEFAIAPVALPNGHGPPVVHDPQQDIVRAAELGSATGASLAPFV